MKTRPFAAPLLGLLACLGPAQPTFALPDDFRVLADDVADRGEWSTEFQAAGAGARGGQPSGRQGLVELSYGLARNVEVSAQFPAAANGGALRPTGANLEIQWIAERVDRGFFWGARAELGQARAVFGAASERSLEARAIAGWRGSQWESALNLSARRTVGGRERSWSFEPSAKLSRLVASRTRLGVEAYSVARPSEGPAPSGRERIALLALDAKLLGASVNVGLGRSWAREGASAVLKTVVGWDLD